MTNEIWLPIKGYEGLYEISNNGKVKSLARIVIGKNNRKQTLPELYLAPFVTKRGYWAVNLYKSARFKTKTIHKLIADYFIPNPENKPEVNHKDGNKLNCNIDNLEWVTPSENISHAYKNKLRFPVTGITSGSNPHAKKIAQYDLSGNLIKVWACARDAYRCGYDYKAISACVTGYRKTYDNHDWRYFLPASANI